MLAKLSKNKSIYWHIQLKSPTVHQVQIWFDPDTNNVIGTPDLFSL